MSHFGVAVEYALHVMVRLARCPDQTPSVRALAEYQGISRPYLAKIMTALQKAGLVEASEGKGGGYRLKRQAEKVSFLDVADAIEGRKPLFECTEVRLRCVLFGGKPPKSASEKPCAIHAVMLSAERDMRKKLAGITVADIVRPLDADTLPATRELALRWFADHAAASVRKDKTQPKRKR